MRSNVYLEVDGSRELVGIIEKTTYCSAYMDGERIGVYDSVDSAAKAIMKKFGEKK